MLSFSPSSGQIKSLKSLQSVFATRYAELKRLEDDESEFIHRYARISTIGASTRIENAVLTDNEINWMDTVLSEDGKTTAFKSQRKFIQDKLSKDRERSIEEVAGCRAMLGLIYEQSKQMRPLSEVHIRGLHDELLKPFEKASHYRGRYKQSPNSVVERNQATGEQRDVFRTADPGSETELAMADLVPWYNEALLMEPWSIAVASEFVFRFLAIHPFQDGNGRLGRGLFLLSLLQCPDEEIAFVSRYLAIDRHIEKRKEEYYFVLQRCSEGRFQADPKKYKLHFFLEFIVKVLNEAFHTIDVNQKKFQAFRGLSPSARIVLEVFKGEPETRLQTSELMRKTGLPRRTVIRGLEVLLKDHFIQRYGQGAGVRYQIIF